MSVTVSAMFGLLFLGTSRVWSDPPPISDPDAMAPPGSMPGQYPTKVTATNMNVTPIAGSVLNGSGSNNLHVTFPSGGPIRWTESRHNEGDIATLIGPFDPNDSSYYPPNTFVDNYQPLQSGQPFANTTLAWRVNQEHGALFASVRHNGVNQGDTFGGSPVGIKHGVAYFNSDFGQGWGYRMNDGVFANGGNFSSDVQMGMAGFDQGQGEATFNVAMAHFPYEEGWQGAWVFENFDGPAIFAAGTPGLPESTVNHTNGVANVTLPGVNSATDGMLFVAPTNGGNNTDIAAAYPTGGGWNVVVREDEDNDFSGQTYNNGIGNGFQFLYVPYTASRLIGGEVQGSNGSLIHSAGGNRLAVSRTSSGKYAVSVFAADGVTKLGGDDGMLMLSVAGQLAGSDVLADRKFLSYEYDTVSGNFIVESREVVANNSPNSQNQFGDELALRDVNFYVAYVDFEKPLTLSLECDFDNNGLCNLADIDLLAMEASSGGNNAIFDLNGDNDVSVADVDVWRALAGDENIGAGRPYRVGDANLDGVVDGTDFGIWNSNKFTATGKWSKGDFNVDGVSDGSDFGLWNANKFTASDGSVVPEPTAGILAIFVAGLIAARRR